MVELLVMLLLLVSALLLISLLMIASLLMLLVPDAPGISAVVGMSTRLMLLPSLLLLVCDVFSIYTVLLPAWHPCCFCITVKILVHLLLVASLRMLTVAGAVAYTPAVPAVVACT